jgi:hypothetical protein
MPGGWGDLYMHDWRGITDLGGTGLDVCIDGGAEGRSGLKVYDMCMDNLNASGCGHDCCPPGGSAVGDPIANSWFTSVDRCAGPMGVEGSSQLGIYKLPVGTYEVTLYHNLWQPSGHETCTNDGYSFNPIEKIHVWSFKDANDFHDQVCLQYGHVCGPTGDALRKMQGFAGPNPGTNVTAIQEAFNVMPSSVTNDEDVMTSTVKFWTDGSPVIIYCQSGEDQSDQYTGDRAPINAFELKTLPPEPLVCPCLGDLAAPAGQVDLQDLDAMVNMLVAAGPPFIVTVGPAHCGDMAEPTGQVDLQDLDALVNMLVAAGPPFIVQCE